MFKGGVLATGAALTLALTPAAVLAQGTPGPFTEIARQIDGRTIIVTDTSGGKLKGRVLSVAPASFVMRTDTGSERTFASTEVGEIKRPGPIWDGALIGGGVGAVLALIAANYGDAGEFAATVIPMSAGIGLGVDALFGPKRIYRAPRGRAGLSVAPLLGGDTKGVNVSLRF